MQAICLPLKNRLFFLSCPYAHFGLEVDSQTLEVFQVWEFSEMQFRDTMEATRPGSNIAKPFKTSY